MRRELTKIINSDSALKVVGTAHDGVEGVEMTKTLEPDVVTIDLNLPEMDGISCLQYIMVESPRPCLMISAYTGKDSVETFEALELGAVDFVEKPSGEISRDIEIHAEEIIHKIKEAAHVNMGVMKRLEVALVEKKKQDLRAAASEEIPDTVVIVGVSTGGPRTLMQIIPSLPPDLNAPVLLIQHMPAKFTAKFAERLDKYCFLEVKEAEDGETLRNNVAYVAPGNANLRLTRNQNTHIRIRLSKPDPEDVVNPSVNKAMRSAIDILGKRTVGVILTGMGNDGTQEMERLYKLGGTTIAESEETAVIYGMPKEVISRGVAKTIAPAYEIAQKIIEAVK